MLIQYKEKSKTPGISKMSSLPGEHVEPDRNVLVVAAFDVELLSYT